MADSKTYENEDIIIHWNPDVCIHAGECVRNAKAVFRPKERPWVQMENGSSQEIMNAIDKCPSGALKYEKK